MKTEAQSEGLGKYAGMGFTLNHDGDHTVELLHEGTFIARFSQTGTTEASLQAACIDHLVNHHPDRPLKSHN